MAENAALEVVLAAARKAVMTWLELDMPRHRQAMEMLVRGLAALEEQKDASKHA